MDTDLDMNAVVSGVIESQIDDLIDFARDKVRVFNDAVKLRLETAFKGYVTTIAERHSRARSFFHRSEPEYLYKFYVPLGIKTRHRTLKRVDAKALFAATPHVVIQGSGGCGKSVLTRHVLLDILRIKERIPVLVELRSLNQEWKELLCVITDSLNASGLELNEEVVAQGIKKGRFALLFDGFDELNAQFKSRIARQIRQLATWSEKTWMVVTSRPDEIFSGWPEFCVYNALPLSLEQAVDLVRRTPIEDELKRRFIADLEATLYEEHTSFLSNPLLLSIMLLTYHDAADIPKKLSVFYSQAYEALFQRHDAWKGGFKRQRQCDLDVHDFGRLFAAFSIVAYDKRLFAFSETEAINFIKKASDLCALKVHADSYLADCTQSVCLLVQDGLQYAYSHRSFQEYFAARFIADSPPSIKNQLLERYAKHLGQDNVINLLHEIQPEFVESSLLLPRLDLLFRRIKIRSEKISRSAHLRFLKAEFRTIRVEKSDSIYATHKHAIGSIMHVLKMAAVQCTHLTGQTIVKIDTNEDRKFRELICEGASSCEFPLSKMDINHPVIKHLYEKGGLLGPQLLSLAWLATCEIRTRTARAGRSLDDLLYVQTSH